MSVYLGMINLEKLYDDRVLTTEQSALKVGLIRESVVAKLTY